MKQSYHKSDTDIETIEVLTAISQVSARMARNLKILAATRQDGGTVSVYLLDMTRFYAHAVTEKWNYLKSIIITSRFLSMNFIKKPRKSIMVLNLYSHSLLHFDILNQMEDNQNGSKTH